MAKDSKRFFIMLLVFSTLLGAIGQLLFKVGLLDQSTLQTLLFILMGLIAYGSSTLAYFYTVSRAHLSWAYGFGGLSYVFASILAFVVLKEPVTALRIAGIVSIAVGTALIGLS